MDIAELKNKFKELYGVSFDRLKLEDALIEHFGTFSIQKIDAWREEQRIIKTQELRPDLMKGK